MFFVGLSYPNLEAIPRIQVKESISRKFTFLQSLLEKILIYIFKEFFQINKSKPLKYSNKEDWNKLMLMLTHSVHGSYAAAVKMVVLQTRVFFVIFTVFWSDVFQSLTLIFLTLFFIHDVVLNVESVCDISSFDSFLFSFNFFSNFSFFSFPFFFVLELIYVFSLYFAI